MSLKLKDGFLGSRQITLPESILAEMRADKLTSSIYVTDIGYYPHAMYHYRRRADGISENIVIFCTDGSGTIKCNDREFYLKAGDFFIIPAGSPHEYWTEDANPWSIYWVHYREPGNTFCKDISGQVMSVNGNSRMQSSSITALFEEIYSALDSDLSSTQIEYSTAVLIHFLGALRKSCSEQASMPDTGSKDYIDRCRQYMVDHIEQRITLADLCHHIGRSTAYCCKVFKAYAGVSPIQYLQELRIQYAVHLFEVTDMKINQVCSKVGIPDPYYFSRIFTKVRGESPSACRRRNKKK